MGGGWGGWAGRILSVYAPSNSERLRASGCIWMLPEPGRNKHRPLESMCTRRPPTPPPLRPCRSAVGGSGNATTVVLVLTELLGFYTISTLLLLRRNLPARYRPLSG